MRRTMIVLAALLMPATAFPEFFTAQHLRSLLRCTDVQCSTRDDLSDWSVGYGYVLGVHDAYTNTGVCSPDSAKAGQIVTVVKRFLDAHPEVWHLSADVLVARALHEQWPCEIPVEGAPRNQRY